MLVIRGDGGGSATAHFFSSESSINNFNMLKTEFDSLFASAGGHKIQPFNNRVDFERILAGSRTGLFVMSSWHYTQLATRAQWKPVLIGVHNQRTTQRHVISAGPAFRGLADLNSQTIASAGTLEFTMELLSEMIPPDHQDLLGTLRILIVPKDIDALLAVGFGVAGAAVTTESGVEKLGRINPRQREQLRQLAVGPERPLLIVAAPHRPDPATLDLIEVLLDMGTHEAGRQRLSMLGLDAWMPIGPEQSEELVE